MGECHRCYAKLESQLTDSLHCLDCEQDLKNGNSCDVCDKPKFRNLWDPFFYYQVPMMNDGIEILLEKGKAHHLCALALVTYTEVMGGLVTGKLKKEIGASKSNFEAFLPYLGEKYVKLNENFDIYKDVRSKLVHEFAPRMSHGIWLTKNALDFRIGIEYKTKHLNFHLREYYRDFKKGVETYKLELENDKQNPKILENFLKATDDSIKDEIIENKIPIPTDNLKRISEGCKNHVFSLLEEATNQHNKEKYNLAIFLTIIALEETSKLAVYYDHIRQLKPVSVRMQKRLTEHNYKIFKIFKTEIKNNKNISTKDDLLIPKMLGSLNFVKQFILYYDQIGNTNMTLNQHFLKHDMTKNNLGHYSTFLWRFTNILFLSELLKIDFAKSDGNVYSDSNVYNSEIYKTIQIRINEFTNNDLPGSESKALFVIDELKSLASKFDMFIDY